MVPSSKNVFLVFKEQFTDTETIHMKYIVKRSQKLFALS